MRCVTATDSSQDQQQHEIIFFRYNPISQTMKELQSMQKFNISELLASDYLWLNDDTFLLPSLDKNGKHSLKALHIDPCEFNQTKIISRANLPNHVALFSQYGNPKLFWTTFADLPSHSTERDKAAKLDFSGKVNC
jgi:hypothetical protein